MRNHKELFQKKTLFRKDHGFMNLKEEYLKATYSFKLKGKELTAQEKIATRNRIIQNGKKENIGSGVLKLVVFLIFGVIISYVFKRSRMTIF